MSFDDRPLGVFDSGLGGLTVVSALRAQCEAENIIYLGDNARVPYGTRSPETVMRYASTCARELAQRDVKALIVACNTVSAVAIEMLRAELDLPVTGVIIPGARAATQAVAKSAKIGLPDRIGVLGTNGTIRSGAYTRAVIALSSRCEVIGQPAPLLVGLAEEGWVEGEVPRLVIDRYLSAFVDPAQQALVGCVVLGCTHFPLFRRLIEQGLERLSGNTIPVVDSATETATEVERFLSSRSMRGDPSKGRGSLDVLVTDMPESFAQVATRFLGELIDSVHQVDLKPTG